MINPQIISCTNHRKENKMKEKKWIFRAPYKTFLKAKNHASNLPAES